MPFTIGPKIHNVIPVPLKVLIEDFFSLSDWRGLYLTGGTCLAEYYFGHRVSIDMDLFTHDERLFQEARKFFQTPKAFPHGQVTEIRLTPHIAQYIYQPTAIQSTIKIDLVLDIPPRIATPIRMGVVWLDTLDDMLANKLGCLISRNEVKDYLDLYQLIPASHLTAKELILLGQKKEAGLDPLIMANQIAFILSQKTSPQEMSGKTDWQAVQLFFTKFQKECLELVRPD